FTKESSSSSFWSSLKRAAESLPISVCEAVSCPELLARSEFDSMRTILPHANRETREPDADFVRETQKPRNSPRFYCGDPNGIRTRVAAVRGRSTRPLYDGAVC